MSKYQTRDQVGGLISYNHGVLIQGNNITTGRDVNINVTAILARSLYRSSITACGSIRLLANDISSIVAALDVAKGSILESCAGVDSVTEFMTILTGCDAVLQSTEKLLLEYTGLSPTERETWERSIPTSDQLADLKEELNQNVRRLTLFNTTQNNVMSNKINDALQLLIAQIRAQSQHHAGTQIRNQEGMNEMRDAHSIISERDTSPSTAQAACDQDEDRNAREGSILSMYTAESLTIDEKENWRQLRKVLEGVGITAQVFDHRQGYITSRIRELIVGGALEEEGEVVGRDLSKSQLKQKFILERAKPAQDSDAFTSHSSIRTFYTCVDAYDIEDQSLPSKRTTKPVNLRPTLADQILKSLGYYRQDKLLLAAIEAGDIPRVRSAVRRGANVNGDHTKQSLGSWQIPLILAAKLGNEVIVRLLVDNDADIEAKEKGGLTPLSTAAEKGHKDVVQLLLEEEANTEARDTAGWSPLSSAAFKGHKDVVQLLLDRGADIEAKDHAGSRPLSAAFQGHKDLVVQLWRERGAHLEDKDHGGWSPLSSAAFRGHKDVVQLLLERGADTEARDEKRWTPLKLAAFKGHKDVVQLLLERGADVEAKDHDGRTPLISAARCIYIDRFAADLVALLLAHGADMESQDNRGKNPLDHARERGKKEVVQLLLQHRKSKQHQDERARP